MPQELIALFWFFCYPLFRNGVGENCKGVFVDKVSEILSFLGVVRIFLGEEVVVESYLYWLTSSAIYPVEGGFYFAVGSLSTGFGGGVVGAAYFCNVAVFIGDDFFTFDDVGVF